MMPSFASVHVSTANKTLVPWSIVLLDPPKNFGLYQNQCIFQKIHSLSTGGAHSRPLVHIASPTSPPYVGTQLTALFHTQPLLKCPFYGIAAQTGEAKFTAIHVALRHLIDGRP